MGGQLIILKIIIYIYYRLPFFVCLLKPPSKTILKFSLYLNIFLWEREREYFLNWVKLKKVYLSNEKGGVGILNLKTFN